MKLLEDITKEGKKIYVTVESGSSDVPIATTSVAGIVKPDGTSVTIDADGTIHASGTSSGVSSVNTRTGAVTLSKTDVGLGNADNTSDVNKPISTATQTALDGKVDEVTGKGLSTNDFTDTLETKLNGIAESANNYTHPATHSADIITDGTTNKVYTATEKTKLAGIATGAEVNVNADWDAVSGDAQILNKPTIPTALSSLADDSTHRLVTDTEKSTWNGKQNALVAGTDYLIPSAIAAAYEPKKGTDDNFVTDAEKTKLSNLSGTNTGDQDLSGYATTSYVDTTISTEIGISASYFEAEYTAGANALFDITDSSLPNNPVLGMQIFVKFLSSNGAYNDSYLKLNSGNYNQLLFNGSQTAANVIKANGLYVCYFNGTKWDMISNYTQTAYSIGEYADAIPYANGDYLTNLLTTESGIDATQIKLKFPLAVDNTKNARLEVLNGTTFYNIKNNLGTQLLASQIENKYLTLYHNGTEWIVTDLAISVTKCTGAEIDTGTDDAKFATAKAIKDSGLVYESDVIGNPIGTILAFGGSSTPASYMLCDGIAISRTTYATLFGIIGTTYGSGDGSTTFNLPNIKGKVIAGYNSAETEFDTLGETGGEKTHLLTGAESGTSAHYHQYRYGGSAGGDGSGIAYSSTSGTQVNETAIRKTSEANATTAHNNLQPYITLHYIIKVSENVGVDKTELVSVIDNLASTSTTDALSANQGKVLNDGKQNKEVVLYNDGTGTSGTITLSETSANFSYIELFYTADSYYGSTKIYSPNGKTFGITIQYVNSSSNAQYLYTTSCAVSGTSLTQPYALNSFLNATSVNNYGTTPYVKIIRVVGYR